MRFRTCRLAPALFVLVPFLVGSFHARPAFAANGGAAVCVTASGFAISVGLVPEPDSGAIVLFVDNQYLMYAQRLDRHGKAMWPGKGLLVMVYDINAYYSNLIPDGSGGALLAWQADRGATGKDILAQRILSNGTLGYAASGLVICGASGTQTYPLIIPSTSGNYFVGWTDRRTGTQDEFYAQRLTAAGSAQWAANGIRITPSGATMYSGPLACSDLAGGLIAAWTPSTYLTSLQKVNSSGTLLWGANGVGYGTSSDRLMSLCTDGSGGAWAVVSHSIGSPTYYEYPDLQHAVSAGTLAFAGIGVSLDMSVYDGGGQGDAFTAVRNLSGGCMVCGKYWNTNSGASYRQEVNASGTLLRGSGGQYVGGGSGFDASFFDVGGSVAMVSEYRNFGRVRVDVKRYLYDGTASYGAPAVLGRDEYNMGLLTGAPVALSTGVLMVTFADTRYSTVQNPTHFASFGQAYDAGGMPLWDDGETPNIVSVGDAPNDQGGLVRVQWNAGAGDIAGGVSGYDVWRSVPASLVAPLSQVRPAALAGRFEFGGRTFLAQANAYWERVGGEPGAGLAQYALTVPTGQDSMAGSPADESFMVEAHDDSSHTWWTGALNGHSVDNLAPPAPQSAAGYYASGTNTLFWGGSPAPDLCCYEVYRGGSAGFVPSAANHVGTTTDVTYTDAGGAYFYRIAARDIHGNIGPSALIMPAGTLAVGDTPGPREWKLTASWRARALTLALDVPQADEGRIELFDVAGRSLWSSPFRTTSAQSLTLRAGVDLPAGVVFARMRASSGRVLNARAILLR